MRVVHPGLGQSLDPAVVEEELAVVIKGLCTPNILGGIPEEEGKARIREILVPRFIKVGVLALIAGAVVGFAIGRIVK